MKSLFIFLVFCFVNTTFAADCSSDANYPEITKSELQQLIDDKKVFIIDVNTKESFAKQQIPGAIHFASTPKLTEVLPKDKNALIVAYCGGVSCTAWKQAAIAACKLNYKNIKHFKPGIKGWMQKES